MRVSSVRFAEVVFHSYCFSPLIRKKLFYLYVKNNVMKVMRVYIGMCTHIEILICFLAILRIFLITFFKAGK